MSAFLIVRKSHAPEQQSGIDHSPDIAAAVASFRQCGFTKFEEIDLGHGRLLLAHGLTAEDLLLKSFDHGDFIYATGTFFFNDHYGIAALEEFHRRFRAGDLPIAETHGCFTVVLSHGGRLLIFTEPLGLSTVFLDPDRTVIASSFLAACAVTQGLSLSVQNVYEYVFNGSVLGNGTLFEQIGILPMGARLTLDATGASLVRPPVVIPSPRGLSREQALEEALTRLRRHFKRLTGAFGNNITCALSGGYDSRLILALLKDQGVEPEVFVYGRAHDPDVVLAKAMAEGEHFPLLHVDKLAEPVIEPARYPDQLRRNLADTDGYAWGGLFSGGGEQRERQRRGQGNRLGLNGGGGEILRNFFYLPDRRFSIRQLMGTFYAQFDPAWCTTRFDEDDYFTNLEHKVRDVLGRSGPAPAGSGSSWRLERHEVEWLYPAFRCRSWVAKEVQLANWWGQHVNPFLDHDLIALTIGLPIAFKDLGRFEAELIRRLNPALAGYPSAYGHSFCQPPPLSYRLKYRLGRARPPWLRRLSFRLRHRLHRREPLRCQTYTAPAYVQAVFGSGGLDLARLFHLDRIRDPAQWNRILTVEYVARTVAGGVRLSE